MRPQTKRGTSSAGMERIVGEAKIRVPEDGGAYDRFVMTEYDNHAGELNLAENR